MKKTSNNFILAALSMTCAAQAQNWTGATSTDWNDAANWSSSPSGANVTVNTSSGNIATVSSTPTFTPVDIFVGRNGGNTGILNQNAGNLASGTNNWMFVGVDGGSGTYNLSGSGSVSAGAINVSAWGGGGGNGTINMNTSGTMTAYSGNARPWGFGDASILVGENNGTGTFNLQNGTVSAAYSAFFGVGSGSTGNLNISGGSFGVTGNTSFARGGGSGTLTVSNGSLTTSNELWLGQDAGGTATGTQSGGTVSSGSYFVIGRNQGANGSYSMTGGTVDAATSTGFTSIGSARGATGSLSVSGGTFNSPRGMILGEGYIGTGSAQGTLNVSATGSVVVGGFGLEMGNDASAVGTVNLDGGTLTTVDVSKGFGTANFNFNGGVLEASGSSTTFITGVTANVLSGGAKIDSNGNDITSVVNLIGSGSLEKQGAGSLNLSNSGNNVGATTVSAGTLYVNGALATTGATVNSGATLGGDGTIAGNVTVNGTISVGTDTAAGTVGTLDVTGATGLTLAGVYEASITGASTFDTLNVSNAFTASGTVKPILSGYAPVLGDIFNIVDFASFSGSPTFDYSLATLGSGLAWDSSFFSTDGTLRITAIVPETSTSLLSGVAALALLRRRRS